METCSVTVSVRMAWWWGWLYVPAVWMFCMLGLVPNWHKVSDTATKAIRINIHWRRGTL